MHEMAIAEGIVDIALQTMRENSGTVIHDIHLKVGAMSGVEPSSLLFCFDAITKDTAAEGSTLTIEIEHIRGRCLDCDAVFEVQDYIFKCPICGSTVVNMETGRELQVLSIDMD